MRKELMHRLKINSSHF